MSDPFTLLLPPSLVDQGFHFEQLLAAPPDRTWRQGWRLRELFILSEPEKRFARKLLAGKRNLWLYRCNQRRFCGDFIVVDMSSPRPASRQAWVIELKMGASLKIGAGGVQLKNADEAVAELVAAGTLGDGVSGSVLTGDGDEVLAWLLANRPQ